MIVEWEASPASDMIADACVALLMHAQSSAASIRLTSKPCRHSRPANDDEPAQKKAKPGDDDGDGDDRSPTDIRLRLMHETLQKQFETIEAVYSVNAATFEIKLDTALESGVALDDDGALTCNVSVEFDDEKGFNAKISVECKDKKIASNVQGCLRNLATSMAPISL